MKKLFFLLTLTIVMAAVGTANSSIPIHSNVKYSPVVPDAVMVTFNVQVSDLMNMWFPTNSSYNADNVSWTRDRGNWVCTGFVAQVGGNGAGIQVVSGVFKNTGEWISFNYNVVN